MAEEDFNEFDDAAAGGGKKKKGIPMVAIIAGIALIMAVGGFFAGKMLSGGGDKPTAPVEEKKDGDKKTTENKAGNAEKGGEAVKTGDGETSADGETPAEPGDGGASGEDLVSKSKAGVLVLDAFTVNLNDPFGRRYAEVMISLEVTNKNYVAKLNENELLKPRMRDEIFMIISNKGYNELKSASGKVTLKEEIMMRLNELTKEEYGKEVISRVNFTKFIIQ